MLNKTKSKSKSKSKSKFPVFDADAGGALIQLGASMQKYDSSVADKLSTSTYLSRLQLMTGNSEKCKKGEFPVNKFALISGQDYRDVGASVDVLVLVWRPKAIDTGSDDMLLSYDIDDAEFQRIKDQSEEKDSMGCMYGQEFLVYLPSVEKFATFFMGTPTSRREAPNMLALLQKAATLKPGQIKTKKYTYYSPSVTMCSTEFKLPAQEECLEEVDKFNNPKLDKVERVETDDKDSVRG